MKKKKKNVVHQHLMVRKKVVLPFLLSFLVSLFVFFFFFFLFFAVAYSSFFCWLSSSLFVLELNELVSTYRFHKRIKIDECLLR